MPIVPVREILAEAARGNYAVGYFENWNDDSLLAVAEAAEVTRSPVLIGFSGIYLPHPERAVPADLRFYAAMGLAVCRGLSVPANLVFNESPREDWVLAAARLGFGLVMFSDEGLAYDVQLERVCEIVQAAHQAGAAVEGEAAALPGLAGSLSDHSGDLRLTDPAIGREFVERTGVDAFAVNIGQVHLHGRRMVRLDLDRLSELGRVIRVPLVLHGASSIYPSDLKVAIQLGVRKINVGSRLKQGYFEALRAACLEVGPEYNPYEVVGSGLPQDVLVAARLALQKKVEELMVLFGSAGQA